MTPRVGLGTTKGAFTRSPFLQRGFPAGPSARFADPVAADAPGADLDPAHLAGHHGPHGLEIRIPAPLDAIVRVADVVAGRRTLAADGTDPSHSSSMPVECEVGSRER